MSEDDREQVRRAERVHRKKTERKDQKPHTKDGGPTVRHRAKSAEELNQLAQMGVPAPVLQVVSLWQLAPDDASYGKHAGWWLIVTPDGETVIGGARETEEEARAYAKTHKMKIVPPDKEYKQ